MSRHIELLLSRRETFPINLCSGGCINSKKAIGERLYGFFYIDGGEQGSWERALGGGGEVGQEPGLMAAGVC